MRRALATATIAAAFVCVPVMTATAFADTSAAPVLASNQTDTDEPLLEDGNDDTGKYGLIGLSGLLGLFGYKKYRDHQAARSTADDAAGSSRRI